jgi:gas vesicle protein
MSGEATAALLGALVGGVLTGAVALLRDRLSWERRKATRWDDVRRQSYAAFLHAAQAVAYEGHVAPYSFYARLNTGDAETSHEALTDMRAAEDAMWAAYREIELVGGRAVIEAAREVAAAVRDIATSEAGVLTTPSEKTLDRSADVHARVGASLERFKDAARREIGVVDAD